jgi:hypothetical protein
MNLITFPHFTAGTMMVIYLTSVQYKFNTTSGEFNCSLAKKLGVDNESFSTKVQSAQIYKESVLQNSRFGWSCTHSSLAGQDISMFDTVLNISTTTFKSRFYRWARCFHQYYMRSAPWQEQTQETIRDKMRETAKNYLLAYPLHTAPNAINLEFSDIVEETAEFKYMMHELGANLNLNLIEQWKKYNSFLYNSEIWKSLEFDVYCEAEYEHNLEKHFRYE